MRVNRNRPARNLVHTSDQNAKWKVKFYNSKEWRDLSKDIYDRDFETCQACLNGYKDSLGNEIIEPRGITFIKRGTRTGVAHHIIPLTYPPESPSNLDPDNILLVCHDCHNKIHGKEEELSKYHTKSQKEDVVDAVIETTNPAIYDRFSEVIEWDET